MTTAAQVFRTETNGHVGNRLRALFGMSPRVVSVDYKVYQPRTPEPAVAPLSTTISGSVPSSAVNNQPVEVLLTAEPVGGAAPYSCEWQITPDSGIARASINPYPTLSFSFTGSDETKAFTILLIVTDAAGRTATATKSISTSFSNTLAVSLNKTSVSFTGPAGTGTTDSVTATITGGVGPYVVTWARISGPTSTPTNPNGTTTAFTKTSSPGMFSSTWKIQVTDHYGNMRLSSALAVDFTFF